MPLLVHNKYRYPLFFLGPAVFWIIAFLIWSSWIMAEPLNMPISLDPPGKIEQQITIVNPENYNLNLIFDRSLPFEQLKSLIGAMGLCPEAIKDGKYNNVCSKGVPVPIHWSLQDKKTGSTVAFQEVESLDSSGWSRAWVERKVDDIHVKNGTYIFRVEILRPVPELARLKPRIAIQFKLKNSSTWQSQTDGLGTFIVTPIAFIVTVVASITLLFRFLHPLLKRKT